MSNTYSPYTELKLTGSMKVILLRNRSTAPGVQRLWPVIIQVVGSLHSKTRRIS